MDYSLEGLHDDERPDDWDLREDEQPDPVIGTVCINTQTGQVSAWDGKRWIAMGRGFEVQLWGQPLVPPVL